ncbi:pumilio homolog 12-like [Apium graveolens]|uniref:pumilio homolog 12-like n=1 Tax=Apium graveolens TaxID=4045 RepID=UPI003D79469F
MESNTNINRPFLGFVNPSESDNMYPVNVPHALPESLLDDFTRMNLSGYSHQAQDNNVHGGMGSFLGINNNNNYGRHVVDSPRMVLDSATDMQRMSVLRAQAQAMMQRQLMYLQGSGNMDCVANSGFLYNGIPNVITNGFEAPAIRLNRGNDYGGYLAPNTNVYLRDNGRANVDNMFVYDYLMNNGNGIVSANNGVNNVVSTNNNLRNHRASTVQREQTFGYSSIEEVRGSIYKLTRDQAGCKFLGEKIEKGKPEDIEMIFVEIKDHVRALMVDQMGNFVMQKFFEFCNQEQMNAVLMSVINDSRSLLSMCLDMHGTRAVQKMVENLKTPNQMASFASVLKHITLPLIKSVNGHHVIQNCLKFFTDKDHIKPILDVVADNCIEIAMDKSGCCALQHCVGYAEGMYKKRLADQITSNALLLSEHSFGNYVVQFILGLRLPQYTADIIRQLKGNFVYLAMNKYGSNVVEKCLKESNDDQISEIINELVYSKDFLMLLQDQYGNYVAQSAVGVAKDKQKIILVHAIQEHYPFIHSHPHGKRVLSRVKSLSKNHA